MRPLRTQNEAGRTPSGRTIRRLLTSRSISDAARDGRPGLDGGILHQSAAVIDQAEEKQAGDPGQERLEAEPVDLSGIHLGVLLLLDQVEAAAVDHPDAFR